MLEVWTAPGASETTQQGGALPFGVLSGAPGAVQTPKVDDFWVPEKFIESHLIHLGSYTYEPEVGSP